MNGDNKMKISLSIWDLCIFDMRQMISDNEQDRLSSMNYTNFWLRSIEMHARGAPIFLIGTFKDIVSDPTKHKEINKSLCLSLNVSDIAPSLVMNEKDMIVFWPIDNSKSGND